MEDFLKFLLIAGVILVGIFKEVNKNKKARQTPRFPYAIVRRNKTGRSSYARSVE